MFDNLNGFISIIDNPLFCLITLPLVSCLILLSLSESKHIKIIQKLSLSCSSLGFLVSLWLLYSFQKNSNKFQIPFEVNWYKLGKIEINSLFNLKFALDGISIFFVVLVTFICFLCVIVALRRNLGVKYMLIYINLIQFFCLVIFTTLDILVFYMFFESVLMPMFIMIGVWGSTYSGRVKAAYYFFLYTLAGSILFLFAIIVIYLETGTTNLELLLNIEFSTKKQIILWVCTFLGFAVKIPLFPIHIWLPEAHVEAPTEGSVILASILLKLGGYGFLRISLGLFPLGSIYFLPLIYTLCTLGVIYASLTTLVQVDLKKIVAYSSVAHMNLVVLGLFSFKIQGLEGSIFLMLAHGIVSGALFFLVGAIYDRHHTRSILYYGGLAQMMPIFSFLFFFFTMANMSFPGTCNFVGELLILVGIFQANYLITFFAATGVVLSAAYSIWLFNRLCFCNLKVIYIEEYKDLTKKESWILYLLAILTIIFGIFPDMILDYLTFSVKCLTIY